MKNFFFLLLFITIKVSGQTVYKDVAPIFYSRCTSCHNQYSHGASLLGYTQVLANSSTIQAYLNSGYMPPWHPDTTYTRFVDEHTITQTEKTAILNWIANGAPSGDTTMAPPQPVYNRYQLNGVPNLDLQIPTFVSNASTADSHVTFALPTGLTQDQTIRAFEIVAGNPSIVHHVVVSIDTTGTHTSNTGGSCFPNQSEILIGGYAPGGVPIVFPGHVPLKMGVVLKAGSNIMLNIHYPAGTAGQSDSTKIRIYFYPTGTTGIRNVKLFKVKSNSLNLPADSITTCTAQCTVTGPSGSPPLSFFSSFPHSHHLCKRILSYASTSSDTIPLIRINNWDFDFQQYYTYKKMVKITLGHIVHSKHVYDNTSQNTDNPNSPPINVYFGQSSSDEMLIDQFQYISYKAGDEFINVDSLLNTDSLLATSIKTTKLFSSDLNYTAFPNPFEQNITIKYTLDTPAKITVDIYNINGILVRSLLNEYEGVGTYETSWNGKNKEGQKLSSGNYFYIIRVDGKPCLGKITLQ